jgi:glucokinase
VTSSRIESGISLPKTDRIMSTNGTKEYYVGVDLGGTKILAGVFNSQLELLGCAKISTKPDRGPDVVIERIVRCVLDSVDEADLSLKQIKATGVGAPGTVNPKEGRVIFAPNLGWREVALQKTLRAKLGTLIFVANDCNVCTLGVYEQELGAKPSHVLGVFIGTGIGAGIIIDRELYLGSNFSAGEVGHMVLDVNGPKCGCGKQGCFEALASRTALFCKIQAAVKEGQKTVLTDTLGNELANLRSGDLRRAIRQGDKFVQKTVEEAAVYVGIATSNLINFMDPDVVVLGGGVIEALGNEMMPIIEKTAVDNAMPGTTKGIRIVASRLGDNAGITGAAVWARSLSH